MLYAISIHALREEGDGLQNLRSSGSRNFNPRPPRGGRPDCNVDVVRIAGFQSTPSARRATMFIGNFAVTRFISIHALREEGDFTAHKSKTAMVYFNPRPPRGGRPLPPDQDRSDSRFQSTPSARRATKISHTISISLFISIHALREEGDSNHIIIGRKGLDFNPRPPRGGRQRPDFPTPPGFRFQSTPSARRATVNLPIRADPAIIFQSTPSARRATPSAHLYRPLGVFQSTPSARRATGFMTFNIIPHILFQSTPSARRATSKNVVMFKWF